MAVTYGFYNSVNGDRKYNAEQMAQIFDGIINDGVFSSVGTAFAVNPSSGMVISVGAGRAWFNHTWTYNDAAITLTVSTAPAGTLKRIDAVVIEVDTNSRVNTIKIVAGTQAASPVRPTLVNTGGVYQYALAYITVAAGTTAITSTMIASVVGTDTPFVTGPLETVGVTGLYDYWRAEFETWFDHLQDELDSNQAANLQHQIDDLESSKADATEVEAAISEIYKVGDLKITTRTSLGDKWALANGDFVTRFEGPEYVDFLTETSGNTIGTTIYFTPPNEKCVNEVIFASASDNNNPSTIWALDGVAILSGSLSDSYPTTWDIWLLKSVDYGNTWTYEAKLITGARFTNICSSSYYTWAIGEPSNNDHGPIATALYNAFVGAFVVYNGVPILLSKAYQTYNSSTSSGTTITHDLLRYFNGTAFIDITDQYKDSTYINSNYWASTDSSSYVKYFWYSYETEIDANNTKGLVLFIGNASQLLFLALTTSGSIAQVSGKLAYGANSNVIVGTSTAAVSNGPYANNVLAVVKVPNSDWSLIAGTLTGSLYSLAFCKINFKTLFTTGLVENDTFVMLAHSGNSPSYVYNSIRYVSSKVFITTNTGAVFIFGYGESRTYQVIRVRLPWTSILNWDNSSTAYRWGSNPYYKVLNQGSSGYIFADNTHIGFIVGASTLANGQTVWCGNRGMAVGAWDYDNDTLDGDVIVSGNIIDDALVATPSASYINPTVFSYALYNQMHIAVASSTITVNVSYSLRIGPSKCISGQYLPHVDAMYGYLYSNPNYYGQLDGISNVFVKIKE